MRGGCHPFRTPGPTGCAIGPGPGRCLFHALAGLALAGGIQVFQEEAFWLLLGLLGLTLAIEALRLSYSPLNTWLVSRFGGLLKPREVARPTGVGYFLGGGLLALWMGGPEIAVASVVILALGDPAAALVGRRWGRIRIRGKSLEGMLAFVAASLGVGLLLQGAWEELTLWAYFLGALGAALGEAIFSPLEDNLLIPVIAAGVMLWAL